MSNITLIGAKPAAPAKFANHCPECKSVRPPIVFEVNTGATADGGMIGFITSACGAELPPENPTELNPKPRVCGCLFGVSVLSYDPNVDRRQLAAVADALKRGMGKA